MDGNYVKNAWDIHVHASPSLFERETTAADTVKVCREAGMEGIVLKAHHGSTVEVASVLNDAHQDFFVYGGLVLNQFCGGLNTLAVEASIDLGARIIWLPTIHAQAHKDKTGVIGGFSFQKSSRFSSEAETISILDEKGSLKGEVKEILDVLKGTGTVLATGHISYEEIKVLVDFVKKNRLDVKLLLSHVFFQVPALRESDVHEFESENIWLEISYFSVLSGLHSTGAKQISKAIINNPGLNWIMSSDSGQKGNPLSPDAMSFLSEILVQNGVQEQRVNKMLSTEPKRLLGG